MKRFLTLVLLGCGACFTDVKAGEMAARAWAESRGLGVEAITCEPYGGDVACDIVTSHGFVSVRCSDSRSCHHFAVR